MELGSDGLKVIQRLASCRDASSIVDVLRDSTRRLVGSDGITVVLRDGAMCHYVEEDAISPLWKGRRFPLEDCISGWCMLRGERVAIADIYDDPRIPHDAYRPTFVRSLAMVPIRSEAPIGAIGAYWALRHEASAEQLEVLQALADSASIALANVAMIAALQDAARHKDELLAMLAHELRNPLAPIRTAVHLVRLRPDDRASIDRAATVIERQVAHLARLVDDLLEASRLARGITSIRREPIDLGALVLRAVDDQRPHVEARGLALEVAVPRAALIAHADEERIAQVLGNLLDNAAKFTPEGGRIQVVLEGRDGMARIAVRDDGSGIDAQTLPHVFEAFVQADRTLARTSGGLGLGLAICRRVVELHGGAIVARSEGKGRGTEVVFDLPLDAPPGAPETRGAAA